MSAPIYQVQKLAKAYAGRIVLEIEALDIQPGEIFTLVGPSGSGKSTLLRLLNFLEEPTGGEVQFSGVPFNRDRGVSLAVRRRVTMVFQRPLLLNRTVWANVQYALRLRGVRDTHDRTAAALDLVGLSSLAHQRVRSLSGGEAQRVALARAIVLQPEVLLLDEPTANLDPYNVGLIENIVLQFNQQQGTTLVLVTHNVFQARRLAHRVGLLLEGRLIEVADVVTFFRSPRDPRTAAFVRGDMVY